MNRSRLYITLNRPSEWQRCLLSGMTISGGSVTSDSGISGCTMVTGSQDSTEHGFLWRSLEISADYGENTVTRVSAYAADSTIVSAGGRTIELDSFLRDDTVPAGERRICWTVCLRRCSQTARTALPTCAGGISG